MSTHEDWEAAKKRRDNAAVMIAFYYVNGGLEKFGQREVEKFTAEDAEMTRIAKELDGRDQK